MATSSNMSLLDFTDAQVKQLKKLILINLVVKAFFIIVSVLMVGDYCDKKLNRVLFDFIYNPSGNWLISKFTFLLNWDGWFFFKILMNDDTYDSLKSMAFYPGMPLLYKSFFKGIGLWSILEGSPYKAGVLYMLSCLFNLLIHLLNTVLIYKLALLKGLPNSRAFRIGLYFSTGATSIYHIVMYSESIYMLPVLVGMIGLESVIQSGKKFGELSMFEYYKVALIIAFTGCFRSLGILNSAYLGIPLILELARSLVMRSYGQAIHIVLRGATTLIIFMIPTGILFFLSRKWFCHVDEAYDPDYSPPSFCKSPTGFFYNYVQEEYWSVRPFDYYVNTRWDAMWLGWNSIPIIVLWFVNYFKKADWKELLKLYIPRYIRDQDLKVHGIKYLPDLIIMTITCRMYYIYANQNSVERFWNAYYLYFFMLDEFQLHFDLKIRGETSSERSVKAQPQNLHQRVRNLLGTAFNKIMQGLILTNNVLRNLVTPVFHTCSVIPI